jgi:hypothetical protein
MKAVMNHQETSLAYFFQGYNCAQATTAAFAAEVAVFTAWITLVVVSGISFVVFAAFCSNAGQAPRISTRVT